MDLPEILFLVGWFFGLPGLAILQIYRARRKKGVERRCPGCDHELTGTGVGMACPKCGVVPAISRGRPTDPDRVLCRGCDHDLEGLEWNADCPECGLRSAAIPRFESNRPQYPIKALLGGILLAGWLGLTILMVSVGAFNSFGTTGYDAIMRAGHAALKQQQQERQATEQWLDEQRSVRDDETTETTPPANTVD